MKRLLFLFSLVFTLLVLSLSLFASEVIVPEGNPFQSLMELIKNFSALSPLAKGMGLIVVIVQLLKAEFLGSFFNSFKYKRALVVVLGQLYGILLMVSNGSSWIDSIIAGLITSGGGMAIYEILKPLFKKK